MAQLVASDIPVVTIDHIFNNRIAVMSDNVKGMQSLVIFRAGHTGMLLFISWASSSVTGSRLSSFYKTAEELGLKVPDEYVLEAATGMPTGPRRRRSSFSRFPARPPASCIRMILPAWAA